MSKRKDTRHSNALKPSCEGVMKMVQALDPRFLGLCKFHMKTVGSPLNVPKTLEGDFLRWRKVAIRHQQGDFRNSEAEWQSMCEIAQWTLDVNCQLRNQEPKQLPSVR